MMHKAWCNLEEVPYNFSRSSIKFQGHTGWKIDDLNPIWVRLLGRSQLSNPSDLPCFFFNDSEKRVFPHNFLLLISPFISCIMADISWQFHENIFIVVFYTLWLKNRTEIQTNIKLWKLNLHHFINYRYGIFSYEIVRVSHEISYFIAWIFH